MEKKTISVYLYLSFTRWECKWSCGRGDEMKYVHNNTFGTSSTPPPLPNLDRRPKRAEGAMERKLGGERDVDPFEDGCACRRYVIMIITSFVD